MKVYKKPATSKLVAKFDNELKDLLLNDLKAFIDKNQFLMRKKQAAIPHTLFVA